MDKEILNLLHQINNKVDSLDTKVDNLATKVDNLATKVDNLDKRMDILEVKEDENSRILRALEHSAQVNKAEQDKVNNNIAYLSGDIKELKRDVTAIEIITSKNWNEIATLKAI